MVTKYFFVLFFGALLLSGCSKNDLEYNTSKICFGEDCLEVELAETEKQQKRGLMGRNHLAEHEGMFFVFGEDGYHSIWMKGMFIPLDVLWLDKNLSVVAMVQNFEPCEVRECPKANPDNEARYVLELQSGYIQEHEIEFGDVGTLK